MLTLPDVAGDDAVHQITLLNPATWVQFTVTGAGEVRIGDPANVSASRGIAITAISGWMSPPKGRGGYYGPTEFAAYIPTGAVLSVGYDA